MNLQHEINERAVVAKPGEQAVADWLARGGKIIRIPVGVTRESKMSWRQQQKVILRKGARK